MKDNKSQPALKPNQENNKEAAPGSSKDWLSLQNEWQAYQPDLKQVKKKVSRGTWRMRTILILDILVLVAYLPYVAYIAIYGEQSWIIKSWHYVMAVLLVAGVYFDFKVRLPVFNAEGDSTKQVLELVVKRTRVGIVIGRVSKQFSIYFLGLFIVWFIANQILIPETENKFSWYLGLFGISWIVMCGGISAWYENKKRADLARIKKLWQEYLS